LYSFLGGRLGIVTAQSKNILTEAHSHI